MKKWDIAPELAHLVLHCFNHQHIRLLCDRIHDQMTATPAVQGRRKDALKLSTPVYSPSIMKPHTFKQEDGQVGGGVPCNTAVRPTIHNYQHDLIGEEV